MYCIQEINVTILIQLVCNNSQQTTT